MIDHRRGVNHRIASARVRPTLNKQRNSKPAVKFVKDSGSSTGKLRPGKTNSAHSSPSIQPHPRKAEKTPPKDAHGSFADEARPAENEMTMANRECCVAPAIVAGP